MNDIGTYIMGRLDIKEGPGVWTFDDCVVTEDAPDRYSVFMKTKWGDVVCQDVEARDAGFTREMLDAGHPLTEGWTRDVNGCEICPENGEIRWVRIDYVFESTFDGISKNVRYFHELDEAVCEAQGEWNRLSESDKRRYMNSRAGAFLVYDSDLTIKYDCVENAKLAADRQYEADWARDDPEHLRNWFEGFRSRYGVPEEDSCIALFDGGWDGTEDPCELMRDYDISCDKANAILDYLVMQGVEVELKEAEKEAD